MKKLLAPAFACFLLLSCASVQQAGNGGQSLEQRAQVIKAACFEIVAEKPTADSLTYDKPLRWDLVDFATRNDKYMSLGTAFAINANELVTAQHVLSLTSNSMVFKTRYIREKTKEGGKTVEKVYEIEDVHAFDNSRDYVVFTVKGRTFDTWLPVSTSYNFNTKVYTAGDAYGEGIVVREGVLLDTIPESENGAWKFLKSSVATNPGNSGGPLLNEKLQVIGIVQARKDDFCYSLPMGEITPGKATFHERTNLGFAVFKNQKPCTLDKTLAMPMKYADLVQAYYKEYMTFYNAGMDSLLADNAKDCFPNGVSSEQALYSSVDTRFPQIFLQDSTNGSWFCSNVEVSSVDIGKNGFVGSAEIYKDAGVWLMNLAVPDDLSVRKLYDDPRLAMDTLLRGINITRKLTDSDQGSRITSYGPPIQALKHVDRYGRTWQVSVFLLEYCDGVIITLATPTPMGLSMIYKSMPSAQKDVFLYDLTKLTDYVNVSYSGTLKQWDAFTSQPDFLFSAMKNVSVSYAEHATLAVQAGSFASKFVDGIVPITRDSQLDLYCGVYLRKGAPSFDVRKLVVSKRNSDSFYILYRWSKPGDSLPNTVKDEWKTVSSGGYPYDGKVFTQSGQTCVGTLHPLFAPGVKPASDFVYTLFVSKEGTATDQEMLQYSRDFAKGVQIRE